MATEREQPSFPLLEIAAIVDPTTVVVIGPGVGNLKEGNELHILAVSKSVIPKVNLPLVSTKGVLEVTLCAGNYVIARTLVEEKQVAMYPGLENIFRQMKTIERRANLSVNEKEMLGDPGRRQVKVGDVVVPTNDIPDYVEWLAKQMAEAPESKTS